MSEKTISAQTTQNPPRSASPVGYLQHEHESWQALFNAQPAIVQRFLEEQGNQLAEALTHQPSPAQVRFMLPDRVCVEVGDASAGQLVAVPLEMREQLAGGLVERLTHSGLSATVRQRLTELEQAPERAIAVSAGLIRYSTAKQIVHDRLPAGRSVVYSALVGEEIPTQPVPTGWEPGSAITAPTDAIVEEGSAEVGRGELLVPYVPTARRFYLPQWVAFDDADHLLVNSVSEAEAHVTSMQRFLEVLHSAVALAPYLVADEEYQRKRYGMLGQLVNQGRALARYETRDIVQTIQHRAGAQDLNRGLSVNLPYFDDQTLQLKTHDFEIIPTGRIMFIPAFVVRAAREEQVKVAQDTRLSPSTRQHLLTELSLLEQAFESDS